MFNRVKDNLDNNNLNYHVQTSIQLKKPSARNGFKWVKPARKESGWSLVTKAVTKRNIDQGGRQLVYFCEECKKGYSQKCNYKVHMDKHAGVRYGCNVCSKTFAKTQDRDNHMSIHTGVWRFKCDTCDKGFNEKRLHLKHRESHFF